MRLFKHSDKTTMDNRSKCKTRTIAFGDGVEAKTSSVKVTFKGSPDVLPKILRQADDLKLELRGNIQEKLV